MGRKASPEIPPYVSYRTFANFLAELRARGLPARIDRSVLGHKSGTIQSRLLLALIYLGLIRESGQPTERLRQLLEREGAERRRVMRQMVQECYGFVFQAEAGVEDATSEQAQELFSRRGASGETLRRSISFFLALARESGIRVSPYIQPHRRRRKNPKTTPPPRPSPAPPAGEAREIRLQGGGRVRLQIQADLFELEGEEREFVFELIDRFRDYQRRRGAWPGDEPAGEA